MDKDKKKKLQNLLIDSLQEEVGLCHSLLEKTVKKQFKLGARSLHGPTHWQRVREIGLYLSSKNGADIRVVSLFALLHDSKRKNEGYDPGHGRKAAAYASSLFREKLLPISRSQLKELIYACRHHTGRDAVSSNLTIQTCWDADRLDLYRVGDIPDIRFLYTDIAKREEALDFAHSLQESNMVRGELLSPRS